MQFLFGACVFAEFMPKKAHNLEVFSCFRASQMASGVNSWKIKTGDALDLHLLLQ